MSTSSTPESPDARLRAADQASDQAPDLVALRAAVDSRIAAQAGDQLAAARARRWTQWPARAAAVAAACLVVGGGGGYAIGAAGGDASTTAGDGARPAITLSEPGAANGAEDDASEESGAADLQSVPSPGDLAGGARLSDREYWPGYGMRTVFTASGLSDQGGSATAWVFDPAAAFSEATAVRAAEALGLDDAPQLRDGYWSVGPDDGSAANLQLMPDGTVTLSYYDPAADPWACDLVKEEAGVSSGSGSDSEPAPDVAAEPCQPTGLGDAPRGEAAEAELDRVLEALGQDPDAYEVVTEDYGDELWTYVSAHQVVDGQRTGLSWSASLTGAGIQSLYGSLAPVVELGEYDVISPAEAVARLADPRFGVSGGPIAYAEGAATRSSGNVGGAVEDTAEAPPEMTLPGTAEAGSPISWPVTEVHIVDSRLGFALHTQPDGAAVLVPTYELISDDGGTWSMIALTEADLDFAESR